MAGGLDLGHAHVRLAIAEAKKGNYRIKRYMTAVPEHGETPAEAAAAELGAAAKKAGALNIGLTGSALMMRYLPVPPVEDWRLERLMDFEIREIEGRSGSSMASSYNLLPVPRGLDDEDTMLLGLVREDLLEETLNALQGVKVKAFSPNAVALYNAYLALGDHETSTTLLANLGQGTLDLALVRGTELFYARSVSTPLEKRDRTLAERLGCDMAKAKDLAHRHLDLEVATGKRLESDAERVTRPLLPLYESLPTLLGGVVTLCRAQARLSDLTLDRVLLTGGGARTRGLTAFLNDRMRVPVSVWNPVDMISMEDLPPEDMDQLEADGPGAAVALGLALASGDSNLYALEILTAGARKAKAFREKTIFHILMGVAAAAFLAVNASVMGNFADDAKKASSASSRARKQLETSNTRATEIIEQLEEAKLLEQDLRLRDSLNRSASRLLVWLETQLPESLWVETFRVGLSDGKEFGRPENDIPVVSVSGRAEDDVRAASQAFGQFTGTLSSLLPDGESAVQASNNPRGKVFEWSLRAELLAALKSDEEEDQS